MKHIQVENIKCNGCATSIKNNLLKINQVVSVEVNIDEETVSYTGEAFHQHVVQKLADMGYPEKGNNTFISKAKSYVSCATGKLS
jgi:copper chaperone